MSKLFKSKTIASLPVRNCFVRSGTWTELATEDGQLTPQLMQKYKDLAEGELGLVIAGYARVNSKERANNRMIGMYDDKFIVPLQGFTKMFHENNTPIGIQLAMGGTQIHYNGEVDWDVMSPSESKVVYRDENNKQHEFNVDEMSIADIKSVISDFVQAGMRVKQSGFDLVQIHAGHGYFVSQWMNPKKNRRTDEYGINPSKFIIELYDEMRNALGDEYPIAIKINSEENIGDDSNHEAMLNLCIELDKRGINMIEVSGCAPSRNKINLDTESYFSAFAGKLKSVVATDVVLTGGNKTLSNIEKVVELTKVDGIGLSRTLVSESNLVAKWKQNPNYKSRCISCNHCHRKTYVCVFDK